MNLPFFYIPQQTTKGSSVTLDEDTSRHVVQVLRMGNGEKVELTDGAGSVYAATISDDQKKKCVVEIKEVQTYTQRLRQITVGISLLKNTSRFEWFLEKAIEIGVSQVIPLICDRTEKQKFRYDRMQQIMISAMLQSQQAWLPALHEPLKYSDYIAKIRESPSLNLIAHCEKTAKISLKSVIFSNGRLSILVGPEGDFSRSEIDQAIKSQFQPVSLGHTRLRSETAGIVALTLLNN